MLDLESHDKRFFGIYRGVVVDNNDPLGQNRLKIKVPQITGGSVTNWAWPCRRTLITDHEAPNGVHARGYNSSTAQQTIAVSGVATSPTLVTFNTITGSDSIKINGSQVSVGKPGAYYFEVNLQVLYNGAANDQNFLAWFRKNNVNIGGSAKRNTVRGSGHYYNFTMATTQTLDAGDYLEVACAGASTGFVLDYDAGGGTTNADSSYRALFNMFNIAGNLPEPNSGVWVMYEGGDPNFPVWMGVF